MNRLTVISRLITFKTKVSYIFKYPKNASANSRLLSSFIWFFNVIDFVPEREEDSDAFNQL
jgi:hypothetical protein